MKGLLSPAIRKDNVVVREIRRIEVLNTVAILKVDE
jgi:hypothetical protein